MKNLSSLFFVTFCTLLATSANAWSIKDAKNPSREELEKKLSPTEFQITQNDGTEQPFRNEYWHNKEDGIYIDVVSGAPVFSSLDKYDSGTGWPSFTRPLNKDYLVEKPDPDGSGRTEVRSKFANAHFGHVFPDGPKPTGMRYCMNSAALKFIPKDKLKAAGYGEYVKLFEKKK